jgi:hypothetical protein
MAINQRAHTVPPFRLDLVPVHFLTVSSIDTYGLVGFGKLRSFCQQIGGASFIKAV